MKSRRLGFCTLIFAAGLVFQSCGGAAPTSVDLIAKFPEAEARSNLPKSQAFGVISQGINGENKRAIVALPTSRIIWRLKVPRDAWLRAYLGVKPEAWDKPGDGVLFRIGVSDGRNYEELLNQHVDPVRAEGDRRWIPVHIDLSAYSEQQVEVIFNTNSSLPGKGNDTKNDLAVWGEPGIYSR